MYWYIIYIYIYCLFVYMYIGRGDGWTQMHEERVYTPQPSEKETSSHGSSSDPSLLHEGACPLTNQPDEENHQKIPPQLLQEEEKELLFSSSCLSQTSSYISLSLSASLSVSFVPSHEKNNHLKLLSPDVLAPR